MPNEKTSKGHKYGYWEVMEIQRFDNAAIVKPISYLIVSVNNMILTFNNSIHNDKLKMINKPMFDKLAILLVGAQNTGKTSTLREYCEYYENISLGVRFRKGWRIEISPFRPKFSMIKVPAYFVQSSPTESNKPLANSIDPLGRFPDLLFVAEQLNGTQYPNTVTYLRINDYHIKEFVLSDIEGLDIWDRWTTKSDKEIKLLFRRETIADYVRSFILSRI